MSHEISTASGRAEAMYALTPAEAFRLAGLDWEVATRPLFYSGIGDGGEAAYVPVTGRLATVRADTGACLGVVSEQYKVVQNSELFQWCDKLVGTGDVRYESAGALRDGRIVWLLARLPERHDLVTDGDQLARYLLMYNGHDGSNSVTILPTSVRVVCWNTISLADPSIRAEAGTDKEATEAIMSNKRRGGVIRVSHTELPGNPGTSITNAAELLAMEVCRQFRIDPRMLTWIEHYGYPSAAQPNEPRGYARVSFNTADGKFSQPDWVRMTDWHWEKLGIEVRAPVHYKIESPPCQT